MATDPVFDPSNLQEILEPEARQLSEADVVFVLGAAGSGCDVLARALSEATGRRYEGPNQIAPLLQRMLDEVQRQYVNLSPEYLGDTKGNLIANTSQASFEAFVSNLFLEPSASRWDAPAVEAMEELERRAPTTNSCRSLARLLPRARFVFLARRPVDLVMEKMAEKPNPPIQHWCWIWKRCLETWAELRDELGDRRCEVHHHEMAVEPEKVAGDLGSFLGLEDAEVGSLKTSLEKAFADEAGAPLPYRFTGLDETPWKPWQQQLFRDLCQSMMEGAGYALEGATLR